MKILRFDEIDSTNTYLKNNYQQFESLTVACALHQTNGKGRLGRKWEDDTSSLLFSILLKDDFENKNVSLLSLLSGECLFETLKEYGIESLIKWPNDVLIKSKKCAGILLESVIEEKIEAIIIGIGINVNNNSFPDDIKNKAISLYQVTNKKIDKNELLDYYLKIFQKRYSEFLQGDNSFMKEVIRNSYLDQKEVFLNYYDENMKCRVIKINDDGTLQVSKDDEIINITSGEVTLEKNY